MHAVNANAKVVAVRNMVLVFKIEQYVPFRGSGWDIKDSESTGKLNIIAQT